MERLSYFDLHADTLTTLLRSDGTLERNALQASISGGRCFESYSQVWAIFTEPGVSYAASWERLRAALSHSARYLTPQSGTPDGDSRPADPSTLPFGGTRSYTPYLSIENATMVSRDTMEGDTEYLARCGVRLVAPVWRGENALGGAHNTAVGLTRLGKAFIREIMRLGMVPDVSHCSHESTAQIISAAEAAGSPAIASHSCSAALCGAGRNLTDDEFSALVRIGGIVGVSLYPPHLDVSGHADAERAAEHIMHYLSLGGEHAVCLGCDLDGIESTPDGIDGIRDLPKLADSLVSLGASAETVERVFYRNAQEFFDRNGLEPLGDRELRYAATTLPPSLGSLI